MGIRLNYEMGQRKTVRDKHRSAARADPRSAHCRINPPDHANCSGTYSMGPQTVGNPCECGCHGVGVSGQVSRP
jgi:hypothetical protein